ncbi:VWA domain-containing protein [Coriobacteriales bacterium OH1046]|nr:VWA domain-containing protein [Coriobacteriales bacterium OH1046]
MGSKSRNRVFALVATVMVAITTALVGFGGLGIAEGEPTATPPGTAKTLTDNGDGTYTLSLSVTGRAESSSTSSKADVIVVLDRSGSMRYDQAGHSPDSWQYSGPSRLSVATSAVNSLAGQLLANNTADNPDRVQLSLVTFSSTASTDITGTTSLSQFQNRVNSITANGGTNWEDALQDAHAIDTREGANVYVIFVSDGNPTFRNTQGGGSGYENAQHGSYPNYYYGSGNSDNNGKNFQYALVQAQAIVNAGKIFYSIGAFGDATNMQNLATQSGAPASNYYDATDQSALNAAFDNIIAEITNAFGYKDVKIEDGITSLTSALVRTDPSSFTYTRSGGSYGTGTAWNDAPGASYADGKVTWDLGTMQLENGVTYTVSFKVWPSQEAYDLVADLNNGFVSYDDLTPDQKAQIVAVAGGYGLKTNTDVTFSYTQIETITTNQRPEGFVEGQPAADGFTYTYDAATGIYTGTKETPGSSSTDSPDPMPLTNSKMTVTKAWNDSLDPNQRPDSVTLRINRDDDTYTDVVLNEANNWTQQIDVAPGLIADGQTLETGHDYTIEEIDGDYHFELDADPFHPMIVDGVLKKSANASGSAQATATATNDLKGRLNISKTVTHSADTTPNPNQLFTYTIKVTDKKGDDVWFSIGNSSGPIDVSGENRVTGATVGTDPKYYSAASGAVITVKIKGGENILFLNLPHGSTYEVEEINVPSAYTCTVANDDSEATTSGNKTSGSIAANTQYNVAYTNAYAVSPTTATIPVTKVLSIPAGQTGPEDITGKYTFTLTAAAGTPMPASGGETVTNPAATGGTASFGSITYTTPGTYTYTVTETGSVDGVNNDPNGNKTITVVVTDNGDGTLSATVNGATPTPTNPADTTFTNSYATTEVSVQIPVTKTLVVPSGLTGPGDITGKYTFTLAAQDGAPMPASGGETVTNPAATGGTASFGSITYDTPGEYTYTITESGTVAGVINDGISTKTVTVTVSDDGHGHLSATSKGADSTATEPKSSTTFTNTYGATPATANIPVKKVLNAASGLTPPDITGAYTFTLAGVTANAPMPAQTTLTNPDANGGTVTFGEISFDRIGTYTYTVSESGTVDGVTNDSSGAKTVVITVTDNGAGALSAQVSVSANNPVTFTNTYTVTPTTASVPVTKALSVPAGLTGPASIREAYTFTLTPQDGAPAAATSSVKNPADNGGTASFGEITFTAPGTYTYTITEAGAVAGVTNDAAAASGKTVTIEVKDNSDGTLTATVKGADTTADNPTANTTFTNVYDASSTTATIPVTKLLSYASGLTPPDIAEQYEFTLAGTGSAPMPASGGEKVKNPDPAGGTASFGEITFTAPGTYTYTVTESGNVAGITNDDAAASGKTVTVTVTDNGDGTLSATVAGADGQGADTTFTNTYRVEPTTASIPVTKRLSVPTGLTGPDIAEAYTFTLADWDEDETSSPLPATTELKNPDADGGTVAFGEITYAAPGTYTYTVTESGTVAGVTNDAAATKTVTVTVTDNGNGTLTATVAGADGQGAGTTFTNAYAVSPTTASFPVKKVLSVPGGLTGPDITGKYTFTLTAAEGTPMPADAELANPDADGGTVTFGPITYSMPGTYAYTVTESGTVAGVTNDATAAKTVTVEVVDNKDGTLSATASSTDASPLAFTNSYGASGSVTLEAAKVAVGFDLADGQFSFELRGADESVLQTKQNDGDGKIVFDAISYSAAGTYSYTINEVVVEGNGIAEDTHVAKVTVTVVDNGDGTLTATPAYEDATFTNKHGDTEKDVVSAADTATSVDGELVAAGDTLTYTITYANNTSGAATVTVTDTIPANTTYVAGSASDGGVESGGIITWTIPDVAAGATGTVTFQVTVNDDANGATIENTATVSDGENQSSSNAVTTSVPVKDVLDDSGSGIDGGSVQVGDTLTYEVTFTLTEDCTSVVVTDGVPANTTLVDGSVSDGGTVADGTITWDLGALAAGTYTVSFKVTVDEFAAGADAITNTASISVNNHSEVETNTTTNTTETGGLTISKEIMVPAGFTIDENKAFTFTVTLVDKNGNDLTGAYNYTGSAEGTISNGGTIQLKHGESVTIEGLPAGAIYTVVETAETGYTAIQDTFTATIPNGGEPAVAAFKNKYGDGASTTASFPVKKVLSVPGGLTGPDITEAYTFTLTAADGTPMPAGTELKNPDADGGTVTFGPITYTAPGTYAYTVTESGDVAGVTNDATTTKTVTVTVTDNGDGTLTATASSTDASPLAFTNSYSVNPTTATITARKVLEHADLAAGAFNFELSAADGTPMPASPNATNAADGTVTFGEITYSAPGEYAYTIKETAGSATYFDYDSSEKTVKVKVVDNGDGTLTATVTGDGEDATFTNTYHAGSDEIFINAVKNVNGQAASQNIFEFTITADDGGALPDETTVANNGGSVTFGPIAYDTSIFDEPAPAPEPNEPETVSLTFSPDDGIEGDTLYAVPYLDGMAQDELLRETRKDDEGVWQPITWTGLPKNNDEGDEIAFEVYYMVDEDATLVRASGLLLQQLDEEPAGEPSEPAAPRTKVFHYTVSETAGSAPGYTYDGHSETVTVTVTDNGDGTLATSVAYDGDGAVFNNIYEASGSATIRAEKVLEGRDLDAGQFEFGLFEGDEQVGDPVANDADGTVTFEVPYRVDAGKSDVGTHAYTVRELGTASTGYTYDSSVKEATVEVTDNGDGTLATSVTYGEDMTFTNTYKPLPTEVVLEAEKVLNGMNLAAGEFGFRIEDEDGNVVSSGTNDASGKITFPAIPITEAGTYTFTAYEVKGSVDGITYDETRFTYEVDVADEGGQLVITEVRTNTNVVFTNTYTPPAPPPEPKPEIPKTGDATPQVAAIVALGAGLAILGVLRYRKES